MFKFLLRKDFYIKLCIIGSLKKNNVYKIGKDLFINNLKKKTKECFVILKNNIIFIIYYLNNNIIKYYFHYSTKKNVKINFSDN